MISISKTISSVLSEGLRRIKLLIAGQIDVQTSYEAMPFGVDGVPPRGWRAIHSKTEESGKSVVIGYLNLGQLESLVEGENRIYSTDEDGALSFAIFLRGDGTCEIGGDTDFMVRYNELETAFDELKAEHDGLVQAFNELAQEVKTFADAYVPGSPTVTGLPPTFTVTSQSEDPSMADITPAKIEEIKTIGL